MEEMPLWIKNKRRYDEEYRKVHYKRIMLNVKRPYYNDVLLPAAEKVGEPVSQFIHNAVAERIKREGLVSRFAVRDAEAGNIIDKFDSLDEAKTAIARYEEEDKKEGTYKENFYEIAISDGDGFVAYEE